MSKVTLPSGLSGEVRGLTGKDGRYLTNEQAVRDNEVDEFILTHCWTATIDDGPYALHGKPIDWGNILVGDRFYTMISIREATYPDDDYTMKLQCGRRACAKKFEWDIKLKDLLEKKVRRLAPSDVETFKNGNVFQEKIPFIGTPFTFKLKTGADARRTQLLIEQKKTGPKKMQERQNLMIESIASYIIEIDGVAKKRDAIFDALEDMPLGSIDALMVLIQSHDCGVDTDIEVFCPHCGGEMMIKLPFDRAFFLPYSAAAKFLRDESSPPTEGQKKKEVDPLEA